jgi:aerobic-type carbon monoxide dehydrogenase small subunit (CoxS/CutS family)
MSDPGTSDEDARMTEGVWQPLPHGAEYDADQTMHVSFAAHLQLDEPAADAPAATWTIPTVEDSDPAAEDSGEYSAGMVPAARNSGEWALPFAADDSPEETGEYPFPEPEPVAEEVHSDHPLASYVLRVNGADRPVTDAWLGESLLYVLRERLGLAGAKDGCEQGECGACSVQVDGRLVASCLVPAATAAGSEVRTVEGLGENGGPSDVQRALVECGAVQCGFCVPGLAMTVHDLLEGNHNPTDLETRQAICGNLCRCSGYRGVLDAVREVVAERDAAAADADDAADPAARIPHQAGPGSEQ